KKEQRTSEYGGPQVQSKSEQDEPDCTYFNWGRAEEADDFDVEELDSHTILLRTRYAEPSIFNEVEKRLNLPLYKTRSGEYNIEDSDDEAEFVPRALRAQYAMQAAETDTEDSDVEDEPEDCTPVRDHYRYGLKTLPDAS